MPRPPNNGHLLERSSFGTQAATWQRSDDDDAGVIAAANLHHRVVLTLHEEGVDAGKLATLLETDQGHARRLLNGSRALTMRDLQALNILFPTTLRSVLHEHFDEPLPEPHRSLARNAPEGTMPRFHLQPAVVWAAIESSIEDYLRRIAELGSSRFASRALLQHWVVLGLVSSGISADEIYLDDADDEGNQVDIRVGLGPRAAISCVVEASPIRGSRDVGRSLRSLIEQLQRFTEAPDDARVLVAHISRELRAALFNVLMQSPSNTYQLTSETMSRVGLPATWDIEIHRISSISHGGQEVVLLWTRKPSVDSS